MTQENETEAKWTLFYDPHSREKGKKTNELVKELEKDLHPQSVRCEPTPYFGKYSTKTTLANVDLVVVKKNMVNKNGEVRVLCEIEERGASPKKIIGDIVNIFLATKIRVPRVSYSLDKSYFILGIKVKKGGKSADKAKNLERRIKAKIPRLRGRIEVVPSDDINELIENIKEKIIAKIGAGFDDER